MDTSPDAATVLEALLWFKSLSTPAQLAVLARCSTKEHANDTIAREYLLSKLGEDSDRRQQA